MVSRVEPGITAVQLDSSIKYTFCCPSLVSDSKTYVGPVL